MIAQMHAARRTSNHELIEAIRLAIPLMLGTHPIFQLDEGIITRGDFGYSFEWEKPVSLLIWERLALTLAVSVSSLLFSWIVAFPIAVYSAVNGYTIGDYFLNLTWLSWFINP